MATQIHIGTASWQEPDFVEFWYPKGLKKSDLLPYYAEHFGFVEVNGSFYGIPQANVTEQWARQTPADFVFTVKLHRLLSRHATEAKFLPPDIRTTADIINGRVDLSAKMEKLVAHRFLQGVQPLIDAKKLGAFLLQLAPSFGPRTNSLTELDNILGIFSEFPVVVELRNRDWMDNGNSQGAGATTAETQLAKTIRFFKERKITFVSVDAPPNSKHVTVMPNIDITTNPALGYFRLHGRDEEAYLTGKTVQARFDYEYTLDELIDFAKRVTRIGDEVQALFIVFNNNRRDFAPKAALLLQEYLAKHFPRFLISKPRRKQGELNWA